MKPSSEAFETVLPDHTLLLEIGGYHVCNGSFVELVRHVKQASRPLQATFMHRSMAGSMSLAEEEGDDGALDSNANTLEAGPLELSDHNGNLDYDEGRPLAGGAYFNI